MKKGKRTEKENLKKDGNDLSSCVSGKTLLSKGMVANRRDGLLFGHDRREDNPDGHSQYGKLRIFSLKKKKIPHGLYTQLSVTMASSRNGPFYSSIR